MAWYHHCVGVSSDVFFALLDNVLSEAGRAPLHADGPERRLVEVRSDDRVLQILAGPGSGKTEMLVWRVLYELIVRGTPADRLMVTTFTRKAATELSIRVVERSDAFLLQARKSGLSVDDPRVHDLRIGTLHSLCDSLLTEFDAEYLESGTTLIDEIEAHVRLRLAKPALGHAPFRMLDREAVKALFRPPWEDESWPRSVAQQTEFLDALLAQHTETWVPRCSGAHTPNGLDAIVGEPVTEDLEKIRTRWRGYCENKHVLDFASIQHVFVERQAQVLEHLDHVFVDEFQDTNPIQFAIHSRWFREGLRLTVVGDDDQSIYRFRGSDIQCFTDLQSNCSAQGVGFRQEKLESNWRSTRTITEFAKRFHHTSSLAAVAMPKQISAPSTKPNGSPVRLVEGAWSAVCDFVATEVLASGQPATSAVLLFSTSERNTKNHTMPASDLRRAFEEHGVRVYNPRNKTAAEAGSPVHELFALVSFLIDPVRTAPAGKNGRSVMVAASDPKYAQHAPVAAPTFRVAGAHLAIQKKFRKQHGKIDDYGDASDLLEYVDEVRDRLVTASSAVNRPVLTLAGFVSRLLSFPRFRSTGYSPELFRQALFTNLLESNIAPTRLSKHSLDDPLAPTRTPDGKVTWSRQFWSLLNVFGSLLQNSTIDDVEVDAFADSAVNLLTFHQAKGLEFEHVYVAMSGRAPQPHNVLRTQLFSGAAPEFAIENGLVSTSDSDVLSLASADRDREVYVAITRAKTTLTVLHDPEHGHPLMGLHPSFGPLFGEGSDTANVSVREFHV